MNPIFGSLGMPSFGWRLLIDAMRQYSRERQKQQASQNKRS